MEPTQHPNDKLTPSQKKAVLHKDGPLLVIAGPGSGKTRVITSRIAALIDSGVNPRNICAITFTNKAADEMRQRAFALGKAAGTHISTFHSLCVRILRQYANFAKINPNFSIYDSAEQSQCIKQAIKTCELDTTNFSPARMLEAVSTLKNKLITPEDFEKNSDDFFSNTLAKIYQHYQNILTENNALDFDDLLMKTAYLLEDNPDICQQLGDRYKFLLIDEYQDTNHAQYKIAKSIASTHNNICVTGDPDQSIYRWRGADIRNILAFETDYPNATVVKLEENFRSTPNILKTADKLIAKNQNRKIKSLIPTRPPGEDIAVEAFEDEKYEALAVADQIKNLEDKGAKLKDIAVFYRVNSASRVIEEAFVKNKVQYQIVRGVEFYSRKEIRDLLGYLKILVNPQDEVAFLRIINTPTRGIGKTTINKIAAYADSKNVTFYDALKNVDKIDSLSKAPKAKIAVFVNMIEQFKKDVGGNVGPIAEKIFTESGLENFLSTSKDQNALENVDELINAAHEYDKQTEQPSLLDYLQQISLFSDTDTYDKTKGAVSLMTLHAAKGLEFENVFIVGLEEGMLPHERAADNEDELEEERRLFFVGITRAKTRLFISYAKYRTIRGQFQRTSASPFLYELGISLTESTEENDYEYERSHDDTEFDHYDHPSPQTPQFAIGQLVRHKKFGLGRVIKFVDMGPDSLVEIKFNAGQTKTLMLKYAKLEKIE
ncbi:MAG: AAA family ATPase [Planctomycetes bacterium]|nr:AAA family ATPase [Planctomycetota bacterium]